MPYHLRKTYRKLATCMYPGWRCIARIAGSAENWNCKLGRFFCLRMLYRMMMLRMSCRSRFLESEKFGSCILAFLLDRQPLFNSFFKFCLVFFQLSSSISHSFWLLEELCFQIQSLFSFLFKGFILHDLFY